MRRLLASIFNFILDIVYTRNCILCGTMIVNNDICICFSCERKITYNPYIANIAQERLYGNPLFKSIYSFYEYHYNSDIRKLILELKYNSNKSVAEYIVKNTIAYIPIENISIDIIIAVPIEYNRLLSRGYNQSKLIAKEIARHMDKPYYDNIIKRKRNSHTQTTLNKQERFINAQKAFFINPKKENLIKDKTILLVDDVLTTGSTLLSCMDQLELYGAKAIYVYTLAVAT